MHFWLHTLPQVRMDVLLARQYELLRCLDSNRDGRKSDVGSSDVGSSDPYGNSKKAMMGAYSATHNCCRRGSKL